MPLRDDLLNPIPGENPSGANIRYAPVIDKIKEARRQDDDAPAGMWEWQRKTADWPTVIKLASDAIATQSKDLQLTVWLTEALLKKEGLPGLLDGLRLLRGLLENFWDTIYPENDEGDLELRAAPVEWLGTKLGDAVKFAPLTKTGHGFFKYRESKTVPTEQDAESDSDKGESRRDAVEHGKLTPEEWDLAFQQTPKAMYENWNSALEGSLAELEALNDFCNEKFGDFAPSFIPLRAALEEVHNLNRQFLKAKYDAEGGTPEPAAEESVEEEAQESQDDGWGAAAAPARPKRRASAIGGIDPADVEEVAPRLAAVAKFLRANDPYSPGPYLLLRGYRWGELRASNPPDPMLLVAPPTEIRQQVKMLALESNWAELLEVGETAMAEPYGRAWLDLQRYIVRACDDSGYSAIAEAIRSELKALVKDLPDLPKLTLMDDTPTANAETLAWIEEMVAADAPPPAEYQAPEPVYQPEPVRMEEPSYATDNGEPRAPDTFELAMDAARSGRTTDAIEMLAQDIPRQSSGRGRFQRKLQIAQICMSTGNEDLALPLLQELEQQINEHRLDAWESPDVVAHPLSMLYRCLNKTGADPSLKQALYARVSRLDPVQALSMPR